MLGLAGDSSRNIKGFGSKMPGEQLPLLFGDPQLTLLTPDEIYQNADQTLLTLVS